MNLIPLPAFQDNYLWLLQDGHRALVVDPGDADPVHAGLRQAAAQLEAILVTHHHADHTGGVASLRESTGAAVFAPVREAVPEPATRVAHGDTVRVLGLSFQVIAVPGHTAGHIAYYCPDAGGLPLLFCGDTLFSGGCGRLFEGTPAQMLASLDTLSALPGATRVCCAHEYTLSNLRFACAVEPDNTDLQHYLRHCEQRRAADQPTLPSTLAQERLINPFLRTREATVVRAAHAYNGADPADEVAVFAAIREWKNNFR
ncbi:hydroxyacylglutathione hydrolase [Ramlibacter sp. AN1015]|uniref:hydroxyacylglutathione hydrolase n=1 Tax=Ramlibacter sp. AN1015 TaxID=3133428 RepID=UPI0030BB37A6